MKLMSHWINGEAHTAGPPRTGPLFNPAIGEQTADVAMATPDEVAMAVSRWLHPGHRGVDRAFPQHG